MIDAPPLAREPRAARLLWFLVMWAMTAAAVTPLLAAAAPTGAAQQPGEDLSAYISSEDARLGAAPGTIVLAQAGQLAHPVTLGRGHTLEIRAAITWAATVRLAGSNVVRCAPNALITATVPEYAPPRPGGMLLLAEGTSGIHVEGCHISSATQSVLLAGLPVSDVTMQRNVLAGLTLVSVNSPAPGTPSQRLSFTDNTVTMPPGGAHYAALLLFYAKNVVGSGNMLTGLTHGIQWWGGNSGAPGMTVAQVTLAGQMSFTGNICKDIGGACIWGSMGADISIRGNTADGCGDVCFDTEGGLRTEIVDNTATRCGNGCAAIFFFTDQTVISRNHFRADAPGGGLIFIKNVSQNPIVHRHLTIEGNELRCLSRVCRAMYQEAASEISFRGNQVTDGTWLPVGYARSVTIAGNHVVFTRPIPAGGAAISAPAVIAGTALEVVSNTIDSQVKQPASVVCIAAGWSDYNAVDPGLIAGNQCGPPGAFAVGVRVSSSGTNPGLFGAWVVGGNRLGGAAVEHVAPGSHERFIDLGQCTAAGCGLSAPALAQAHALPGCAGTAPANAVCLGAVRGWATPPTAP